MPKRPPLPPFGRDSAIAKVRATENVWNTRNPASVALACTKESRWRSRTEFLEGCAAIEAFLARRWNSEFDCRLVMELWAFAGAAIAVRLASESRDAQGRWWRSLGNENWRFAADGLIAEPHASINEEPITEAQRLFRWPLGTRPQDHPGLTELGI